MANVFRAFKMPGFATGGEGAPAQAGEEEDEEDITSGESQVAVANEEKENVPSYPSTGSSRSSHSQGAMLQVPQRRATKNNSATRALKDGFSAIRDRITGGLGSRFRGQSSIVPEPKSSEVQPVYGSSTGSASFYSPPADTALRTKYDVFRHELSKSDRVRGNMKNCATALHLEKGEDRNALHRLCDLLFLESWKIAEHVFSEDMGQARKKEEDAKNCERMRIDALASHMKDVTALRDQLRSLPSGTTEALAVTYFSPLSYVDEPTRNLVHRIVEEQLKAILSAAESGAGNCTALDTLISSRIESTLEAARVAIAKQEQERLEAVFQRERKEHQRLAAELEQKLAAVEANLKQKEDELLEEAQHHAEQLEISERLRAALEKEQMESKNLGDRLELVNAALASAQAEVRSPPVSTPPPLEQPEPEEAQDSQAPELLDVSGGTQALVSDDQIQQMMLQIQGERRPILPGAGAAALLQHAVRLHADSDQDSTKSSEAGMEVLIVLVRMVGQLAIEIGQETSSALPHFSDPSLVIKLLSLHAAVAHRQGALLFVLAALVHKAISELFGIVQSKGGHQVKLTLVTKCLEEIRCQSRRQISTCLHAARQDFGQLESLRQELKNLVMPSMESDCDSSTVSPYNSEKSDLTYYPSEKCEKKAEALRKSNTLSNISEGILSSESTMTSVPSCPSPTAKPKASSKKNPPVFRKRSNSFATHSEMFDGVHMKAATFSHLPQVAKKDETGLTRSSTMTNIPEKLVAKSTPAKAAPMVRKNSIDLGATLDRPASEMPSVLPTAPGGKDASTATDKSDPPPARNCSAVGPKPPVIARKKSIDLGDLAKLELDPAPNAPEQWTTPRNACQLARKKSVDLTNACSGRAPLVSRRPSLDLGALAGQTSLEVTSPKAQPNKADAKKFQRRPSKVDTRLVANTMSPCASGTKLSVTGAHFASNPPQFASNSPSPVPSSPSAASPVPVWTSSKEKEEAP